MVVISVSGICIVAVLRYISFCRVYGISVVVVIRLVGNKSCDSFSGIILY